MFIKLYIALVEVKERCDVGTLMNNIRYKSTLRDKNKARKKGGLLSNKGARKKGTTKRMKDTCSIYSPKPTVVTRILQYQISSLAITLL